MMEKVVVWKLQCREWPEIWGAESYREKKYRWLGFTQDWKKKQFLKKTKHSEIKGTSPKQHLVQRGKAKQHEGRVTVEAYPRDPVHAHDGQAQHGDESDGTHDARVIHCPVHYLGTISIVLQ